MADVWRAARNWTMCFLPTPLTINWGRSSWLVNLQVFLFLNVQGELKSEHGLDLLNKLLALDPSRRVGADSALKHPFFAEEPTPAAPDSFQNIPITVHKQDTRSNKSHSSKCRQVWYTAVGSKQSPADGWFGNRFSSVGSERVQSQIDYCC